MALPCAKVKHTAKHVFICRHSAKLFFAVCPRNCTRQIGWHTANVEFPVVSVGRPTTAFRRASLFACIYLAKRYNLSPNCDFFYRNRTIPTLNIHNRISTTNKESSTQTAQPTGKQFSNSKVKLD